MEEKSKKRRRCLFLFLHHLSLVGVLICLMATVTEYAYRGYSLSYMMDGDNAKDEFEDTDVFYNLFSSDLLKAIRYAVICDQFETNGVFDGKKEIDIQEYAYHTNSVSTDESGVRYYLEDLIKWGQMGYSAEDISSEYYSYMLKSMAGSVTVPAVPDAHSVQENVTGTVSENTTTESIVTEEQVAVPEVAKEKTTEDASGLLTTDQYIYGSDTYYSDENTYEEQDYPSFRVLMDEVFRPVDGMPLVTHTTSPYEYQDYTQYLFSSIDTAYSNYLEYKTLKDYFANSNFKYFITYDKDGQQHSFSNYIEDKDNILADGEDNLTRVFERLGKYIYCDYGSLDGTTNYTYDEEDVWREISYYSYSYPVNVKLWFAVDTDYQQNDDYYRYKSTYSTDFILFRNLLVGLGAFSLVYIVLLILLTSKERPSSNGVRYYVDRIYTEIAFFLALLLCGGIAGSGIAILAEFDFIDNMSAFTAPAMITCGVTAFLFNVLFMYFYLSLVRRIKDHTLWNRSILHRMLDFIWSIYNNPRVAIRTWVPYCFLIFVNLFFIMMEYDTQSAFPVLLLGILDLEVGLFLFRENKNRKRVIDGVEKIQKGDLNYQIDLDKLHGDNLILAKAVNKIGDGIRQAVETSMKDERLKADLITNVSHDIKTPLTSIINYVDLIKREEVENEKVTEYIKVLDSKSQRLKQLTEDLVEASKISSGNIELIFEKINFIQLIQQTLGEFDERFKSKGLEIVVNVPAEPVYIRVDSRRIWRVIENLYSNLVKYAMENTRVYVDLSVSDRASLVIKNISSQPLNIKANELTERFIRGDISRNTEGSGLGLSIAKNLTELQHGTFEIYLDGDLFKVMVEFPVQPNV